MKNLKFFLPLFALILGIGLVFSQSAFTSKNNEKKAKRAPVYFKYEGTTFDEAGYRDIDNWQQVSNPGEEACFGDQDICILSVDSENLDGPGTTMLAKLDHFFNDDLDGTGQVASYVNDTDNREAEQN